MTVSDGRTIRMALVLFAWLLAATAYGQVVTGRVVNSDNSPVDKASVYIKNGKSVVAYGFTDKQGMFAVDSKGRQCDTMEVRKIGYSKLAIALRHYSSDKAIVLSEHATELKEVVVKSQRIRQEGDTLNYLVSAFRGKQDRTIADVIRKMPGLTVNDDGSIEYQGTKINKFYIEGMDLLGGKYAQASDNIDAGKVKKVQVLERHQPIRALKDTMFSDQAALNIVLTDSAKNVWSHTFDLSTGASLTKSPDWLYDNRIVSMLFSRKVQSISMYKNNNTGKNIGQEVTPMSAYLDDSAPVDDGMLGNISLPAPAIDASRSRFNHTHLFATNWLLKTHGGNDLRIQLDGMTDMTEQRQTSTTVYTAAGGAAIVQDVSAESRHDALSAEVLYRQNTEKQYLTNDVRGYVDFDRSSGLSVLNGVETREMVKPRQGYITDKLSFVRNITRRYSFSVNAYLSLNWLPGSLLLADSTMQRLRQRSVLAGCDAYFGQKLGAFYLNYNIGTDLKAQHIGVSRQDVDAVRKYTEWRTFMKPSLSYKTAIINLVASAPVYWTNRTYGVQHKDNITFEPNLFFRAMPVSDFGITATYNCSWKPEGFLSVLDIPVFTDYISMTEGLGKLSNTLMHTASANIEYKNVIKGLFATVGYVFTNMRNQRLYSMNVDGNVYESRATDLTSNSVMHGLNFRVSESWNVAHLVTTLSGRWQWSDYNMLLQNVLTPFQTQMAGATATVSLQPCSWFSVEEQSQFSYVRQECRSGASLPSSLSSFSHSLKCYFMPGRFNIELSNEIYHGNDKAVSFTYFADLSVSYRTKRYEVSLTCSNILGKDEYERRQITDTQQMYTVTKLRPRECMVRVEFSL
ncbi:carboxypeptidase-like regulatory domain-containing protein [Prevotella sp.]|uniref:carboxypeptidase-like regulatory domain-containing protein n=1 Tax=Prevotella sp. TaxID=59823 RepID=UPI00257F9241|nr:carboxypeptidase-like regulatory domain-containing protein [Prevotella sp.]